MIRIILDDISGNYKRAGGGGISRIERTLTNTFVVSIPREERIDQITYAFEIGDNCEVMMKNRRLNAVTTRSE